MSSTLGQSSFNLTKAHNDNEHDVRQKQLVIKNINDLPRSELEDFLKVHQYSMRKHSILYLYISLSCLEIWSDENSTG